jgi:hypothetical protein
MSAERELCDASQERPSCLVNVLSECIQGVISLAFGFKLRALRSEHMLFVHINGIDSSHSIPTVNRIHFRDCLVIRPIIWFRTPDLHPSRHQL